MRCGFQCHWLLASDQSGEWCSISRRLGGVPAHAWCLQVLVLRVPASVSSACLSQQYLAGSFQLLGHPLVLVPNALFCFQGCLVSLPKNDASASKYTCIHHRDLEPWEKLVVIKLGQGGGAHNKLVEEEDQERLKNPIYVTIYLHMVTCYTFLLFFSCLRGCAGGPEARTRTCPPVQQDGQNTTSNTKHTRYLPLLHAHLLPSFVPAKHPGDTLFPLLVRLDTAVQDPCKQGSTSRQLTTP